MKKIKYLFLISMVCVFAVINLVGCRNDILKENNSGVESPKVVGRGTTQFEFLSETSNADNTVTIELSKLNENPTVFQTMMDSDYKGILKAKIEGTKIVEIGGLKADMASQEIKMYLNMEDFEITEENSENVLGTKLYAVKIDYDQVRVKEKAKYYFVLLNKSGNVKTVGDKDFDIEKFK